MINPYCISTSTRQNFEIVVVDGKGQFQSAELKKKYLDEAVTIAQIRETAGAFRDLATLIRDFWTQTTTRTASLEKLRERLLKLPNLRTRKANPRPVSPNASGLHLKSDFAGLAGRLVISWRSRSPN
jgi:hypothetical protein